MHTHPCPSTGKTSGACPGYVVDHVIPLKRGGAETPALKPLAEDVEQSVRAIVESAAR